MPGHAAVVLLPLLLVCGCQWLGLTPLAAATDASPVIDFRVDAGAATTPFPHFWEAAVGSGHAALALRRDWQAQLRMTHRDLGFQQVRFHGIFDDDIGILASLASDGSMTFNWTNLDTVYDAIRAADMRPYVEMDFMPTLLANGTVTYLHYKANVTPPRNLTQWSQFVYAFATHIVQRYGIEEVATWMFEVWNEPNLRNTLGPINLGEFWDGTQAQYYALYHATAAALKQASTRLQVGGPTTAFGQWLASFLNYTSTHGAPVDFVSAHAYPTQLDNGLDRNAIETLVGQIRAQVPRSMPVAISEYNSGLYPSFLFNNNDTPFASAFLARNLPRLLPLNLTVMSYWTFSDIFDEIAFDTIPFHDGYGLLTVQGIPKPAYRAFQLLHGMGFAQLPVHASTLQANATVEAVVTRNATHAQILISNWQSPLDVKPSLNTWNVSVTISGVLPASTNATMYRIDAAHSNPIAVWKAMGSPKSLTSTQHAALLSASQLQPSTLPSVPTRASIADATVASFRFSIPRQGVVQLVVPLS